MEADLKLVPAKCGCEGCFYETQKTCPGYKVYNNPEKFKICTQGGVPMIFRKEQDDE